MSCEKMIKRLKQNITDLENKLIDLESVDRGKCSHQGKTIAISVSPGWGVPKWLFETIVIKMCGDCGKFKTPAGEWVELEIEEG